MISFDEAIELLASVARPMNTDELPIDQSYRRILSRDIVAAIDSPRTSVSAMDGYAVADADLSSFPVRLRIVGGSFAGQALPPDIGKGECARIFTGATVPKGADRVVVQEVVSRDGEWALFDQSPGAARHIRAKASDFSIGDLLVPAGTLLDPRSMVAAAAADHETVEVYRAPRFALLSTGDELRQPGAARDHPAGVPESVSLGVSALGIEWGGICVARSIEADDLVVLARVATKALSNADLLVVTGGASVGEKDHAKAMLEGVGLDLIFSKVAIKPGKPVWLGRSGDRLVLGLPGNPTSAMVTARLFLAPLLAGLSGRDPAVALSSRTARLNAPIPKTGNRETFLRARWTGGSAEVLADQDSSSQRMLVEAGLLVRRAAEAPAAEAGAMVEVLDF